MRPQSRLRSSALRPLSFSLARLSSAAAVAAALLAAGQTAQAQVFWDGNTLPTPGDGFLWTDPLNWAGDTVPLSSDSLVFDNPGAGINPTVGTILLNGNQTAADLTFNQSYTLGAYGTSNVLTNTSGNVTVNPGTLATINASYGGTGGIFLSGGGTLFLNNPSPVFSGNITVDGAGTSLLHRQEGPTVQYNGVGGAQEFGRNDQVTLGFLNVTKTITLQNGGEYKIVNAGNNSEGNFKNIVIGSGGGTLNVAAGYLLQNLDDIGQITVTTEAFTKAGKGRLTVSGTMANGTGTAPVFSGGNPLGGIVNINGGMLDLSTTANTTVGANTYVRFSGIAATGSTLNINAGGTMMWNNGTQGFIDTPVINANNGSIIGINGNDHIIGFATLTASTPTSLNISGTSTLLTRDLFGAQTQRFPRLRTQLDGTGTLQLLGNTNAGGTPRVVIERNTPTSSFTGTFRLLENTSLEANPRFNLAVVGGTGTVADTGKLLADGDIEFAGWGSTLDLRDSNAAAATQLGYTTNDISITTNQMGALNSISVNRATTATGTGHQYNFGGLIIGNHRLAITGANSYQAAFTNPVSLRGDATLDMRSAPLGLLSATSVVEDAAGRTLTLVKAGAPNVGAFDVFNSGVTSVSNINVTFGTLRLVGAGGAIGAGFGGAAPTITINGGDVAAAIRGNPTQGILHLDGVGSILGITAANNNNRIVDTATVNMLGNSILRLTTPSAVATTETIGTLNVNGGHGLIDIVKTGALASPTAMTFTNAIGLTNGSTVNFTGTSLGLAGPDTSRIVITPLASGPMGPAFHSGNEWVKYDTTVNNGVAIGVTPFVAGDYVGGFAAGSNTKFTAAPAGLGAPTTTGTLNLQMPAAAAINLNTFALTLDIGGILASGNAQGIIDTNASFPAVSGGLTSSTGRLYVHNNGTLDIRVPVVGAIDFIKSGTGTLRLTHQALGVGVANLGGTVPPSTAATWTSTLTGSWIINDGAFDVHRGQFLGGRPVVLNGGILNINHPVSQANSNTLLPGWGNNIVVNGNAQIGTDDNGESADGGVGNGVLVPLGSLTLNNGATLGLGSFTNGTVTPINVSPFSTDLAFMGGAVFNGRATLNLGTGRSSTAILSHIISGPITGSGFDVVSYTASNQTLVIGGTQSDTTNNTFNSPIIAYGANAVIRLNKANGFTALPDTAAAEDLIINGSSVFWGAGNHGDLATTNQPGVSNVGIAVAGTNNYGLSGIAPTSPAAIKNAGMNQVADTATITLLTGTLGESDRITNEKFGGLIMKNGTFNVGLGTVEIDSATFSGGALGFDRGGTLKIGAASYLPGSFDQSVFTGRPSPGAYTTLEYGAGGVSLTGQFILIGNGFSGNVAGAGGRLRLGGNLTFTGSDLIGGSYGRKGIFVQTGSTFRELGGSHIDLMGGVRDFNIATDSIYTITPRITNGGISKSGGGALVLEPYERSSFAGPIIVNGGVLQAKGDGAFGTSAGGVTINVGGTVKLDSGWSYGDDFTVAGAGSIIPGSGSVREAGALIAVSGTNRLSGAFVLSGNATIAGDTFLDPSVTPGAGGLAYRVGTLVIAGAGGVTGTGTLNLSGNGDGVIANGVNTAGGGLTKDGAGRWILSGAGTYTGNTTVSAGALRIANGAALGSAGAGTTVYGGAALELIGGISVAEPLTISGDGTGVQSGAIVNVGGNNTLTGPITLLGTTLRSDSGNLTVAGPINAGATAMTLTGAGNGVLSGIVTIGPAPVGDVLTKNGKGTWTLSAPNALSGSVAVNGGTLILAGPGLKINPSLPINMGGGNLRVTGAAQASDGLNLIAGGGVVDGGAGLAVGAITPGLGASVNFAGSITTSNANTNGILGGYATVGSDWAAVDGTSHIVALPGAGYVNLPLAAATDNAIRSLYHLVTAPTTVNTLKIAGGSGVDLGGNNMTLASGGLIYSSPIAGGIGGTGLLSGPTSFDNLTVHVTGAGTLDIAAPIIGAGSGGLTKAGSGKLVLSGNSSFTGPININGGTLSIVGPGGTTHPAALGSAAGPRNLNINGGTFEVVGGDYDSGATNMYYVIGSSGATIRSRLGSIITINDSTGGAPFQLSGPGDINFTGGGRYFLSGGAPVFPNFTGKVTVDGGILTLGNSASLGGRADQTITVKSGGAIINNTGFGLGLNGLPNNIVMESGSEMYALGGSRVYAGDVQFGGTHTIALMERDNPASERQIFLNGRVSGTGVTLNVFAAVNSAQFTPSVLYFADGSNNITGTINVNANAVLEARTPGSLGQNNGDVTVNLNGGSARLNLRHFQNGDYHVNVNANNNVEISSDRLVNYAGGGLQILSINNLTLNGDGNVVTIGGGNTYHTRVGGTATFNAPTNTILNVTASDLILENGLTFGTPGSTLDKRGGFTAILRGPTNHTGRLIIQQGLIHLQDNGSLAGTSAIELRGGELRVDNSAVVNPDRINNAAPITLGGGALRITGAETIGTVSAVGGTTIVVSNPTDELVPNPLTLTGFTRAVGSVVQFQSPDVGAGALAVGQNTNAQTRVGSRIYIPGQANTTQTIPGFIGNNNIDFIQYDGTTIDSGFALGVQDMRNPGNVNSPQNYSDNTAETAWNDTIILHRTNATDNTVVTDTLTAGRALDAIKVETGGTNRDYTLAMGANNLRIDGAGIVVVGNTTADFTVTGTTGVLTAGPAVPGTATAELFIGGNGTAANGTININAIIGNNGTQPVALVKTGVSQLNLNGAAANTYTGGTFVTQGTLNVLANNSLGAAANAITLSGGTLQFNIPNAASGLDVGGLGQSVAVNANSLIILDNGALAGINNSLTFGALSINGPYTLGVRGFDSMDVNFVGTHTFTGTPTIDLPQAGSGSNPNVAGSESFVTLNGGITGSGFFVTASGSTDNTQARLRIGGGAADATANTYTGKVTLLQGAFNEDMFVELNKAAGTTAITGDLELNAGTVFLNRPNQIADTSNVVNNHGVLDFNGQNETIASIVMNGGGIYTNNAVALSTPAANVVNVTGAVTVNGYDDLADAAHPTVALNLGFMIGNNSTLNVGGQLTIGTYGRVHLAEGATAAVLNVNGGLQMTGALLSQNSGNGPNIVRLSSDVTTLPAIIPSNIGNSTDSDTFLELNGTRTFTVADGPAAIDLVLSTVIRNSTAPVAVGSLTKNGNGVLQIQGGTTGNSYTGPTVVNSGTVVLFKSAGVNALGDGSATNTLTIGDGVGGPKADQVIIRNTSQIADTTDVTIASSGLLDLDTFNASEVIGNLSGAVGSAITLGPTSILTVVSTSSTTYSGTIAGDSTLNKQGAGTLYLDGSTQLHVWNINVNAGTLSVDSDVNNAVVDVTGAANFGVSQLMTSLNINNGGVVTLGDLPGPPPSPFDNGGLGGGNVGADLVGASAPVQGVPEPGTATLLVGGLLTMLGLRRRRA